MRATLRDDPAIIAPRKRKPFVRSQPLPALGYAVPGVAAGGVCALATCLALHPTRATERRADGNGNKSQPRPPGSEPIATPSPKHTENTPPLSAATPSCPTPNPTQ